ncbi:hypothetical protein BRD00_01595 [Halobacteriales archaeon QS_8_69_26]|nr:MAG: hypothetical protein BRD00_01595 [Halobacteriales archaeon QS_8_69_26]
MALLAGAVGPAAAQVEVPGGIDTATSPEPSTEIVIDGETRVTDWRYEDGVFVLQIEAEDGKPITFMSVPSKRGSGGGQANVKRQYVARGNNTVRFRAQGSDPVVTMTTAQSIEEGRVAYVKATTGIDLFRGPATWGYVWAAGGISFLGGVGAVLYYAREFLLSDDPEVAERVL